jgi:hypothetical protein
MDCCPGCNRNALRKRVRTHDYRCQSCGRVYSSEEVIQHISDGIKIKTEQEAESTGCAFIVLAVILLIVGLAIYAKTRGEGSPATSAPSATAASVNHPISEEHVGAPVSVPLDSSSLCGRPGVTLPKAITSADWSRYACKSQDEAGSRWGDCVAGEVYSRKPEEWCPGVKRCCPG